MTANEANDEGRSPSPAPDAGQRAHTVGLIANVLLLIGKLIVGMLSGSAALLADALNSAGDIVATSIGAVGYAFAKRPPDDDHHYGHGNAESVAGLIIGGILLATGFICVDGARALLSGATEAPGAVALAAAAATVVVKELLYRYVHRVGSRLRSPSLLASARDHRADVFAGVAVFAGVGGARLGWPLLDPVAALGIGAYIAWMAVEPIRSNFDVLMDRADPALAEAIRACAVKHTDVREARDVRVHPIGSYRMVDLEIFIDGDISVRAGHEVAHEVADAVRAEFDAVRDVRVHVNPTG